MRKHEKQKLSMWGCPNAKLSVSKICVERNTLLSRLTRHLKQAPFGEDKIKFGSALGNRDNSKRKERKTKDTERSLGKISEGSKKTRGGVKRYQHQIRKGKPQNGDEKIEQDTPQKRGGGSWKKRGVWLKKKMPLSN